MFLFCNTILKYIPQYYSLVFEIQKNTKLQSATWVTSRISRIFRQSPPIQLWTINSLDKH